MAGQVVNAAIARVCQEMLQGFTHCGYHVKLDSYTPALGNCFYEAIHQQLQRPVFHQDIPEHIRRMSPLSLRRAVSAHVQSIHQYFGYHKGCLIEDNQKKIERNIKVKMDKLGLNYLPPMLNEDENARRSRMDANLALIRSLEVRNNVSNFYIPPPEFNWNTYCFKQSQDGEYAEEIWIQATAHFLTFSIHVCGGQGDAHNYGVNRISSSIHLGGDADNEHVYFILGHSHAHFQSFLPIK